MSREQIRERIAEQLRAEGIQTENDANGPAFVAPLLDVMAVEIEAIEYAIARAQEHEL